MGVDIVDILVLQLVAVVVDFVLDVKGAVGVEIVLVALEHHVHLRQGIVGQLKHLVQMLILLVGEIVLALDLAVERPGDVVAAVADRLYLTDLAEHGTQLGLGLVAQVRIAHIVEIVANLYLHVVRDTLVFLDTGEELDKLVAVGLAQEFAYHAKHALDALCIALYLLLCLEHGEFRGLHDSCLDEAETEIVFLGTQLGLDDTAHQLLYLWDKPHQYEGVGDVEGGVEGRQDKTELGRVLQEVGSALVMDPSKPTKPQTMLMKGLNTVSTHSTPNTLKTM